MFIHVCVYMCVHVCPCVCICTCVTCTNSDHYNKEKSRNFLNAFGFASNFGIIHGFVLLM